MRRTVPNVEAQTYIVKATDQSLAAIARRLTGSADYSDIYELNKDTIGSNPNDIAAGMVLTIPGDSSSSDGW